MLRCCYLLGYITSFIQNVLVFGKFSEFYISRLIQNGRSSFRKLQACNAYVFTDLAEQIVVIIVTCCYLPTEQKASDISGTNSSEDIT